MRRIIIVATLLTAALAGNAPASTLDPSHRVWEQSPYVEEWVRALADLRQDLAPRQKWHPVAARGRIAAVGRRVLVIPVLPADAGGVPRSQSELQALWSGDGEATVEGFWRYVSAGGLDLDVRVLPWLEVPGTLQSEYLNVIDGAPVTNLAAGPRNLATDALEAAAAIVEDLHVFDDDGPDGMPGSGDDDGILDLVVVLHPFAGWETDPVDVPRAIVSLQTRLGGEPIAGTDLRADAFMVASASGPLGVWVHELGHLLGLPDLYDLDRSPLAGTPGGLGPQGGLGRWSLMASGTWGGDGDTPSGLDAWSRWSLGFGDFTEHEFEDRIGLAWVDADEAQAARVYPLGEWGEEMFLVEARRPRPGSVVDAALPGQGALVYHVRPDLSGNLIGNKFLELLQADGQFDLDQGTNDGDATDPWDGSPGRARLDGTTVPSTASAQPSPARTAPAMDFSQFGAGMEVVLSMASGPALRLDGFGVSDSFVGLRTWLRPGESAEFYVRLVTVGDATPANPVLDLTTDPAARSIEFDPPPPWALVEDEGTWILPGRVEISDLGASGDEGEALVQLTISSDGGVARSVALGLPVTFSDGLPPDALVDFVPSASTQGAELTTFERLPLASLPGPAFVGYELVTNGVPGYANSVVAELTGSWFAIPPERAATLWTRGDTEQGIPGQVFDGAALEIYVPERGWLPLEPEGPQPVWITRRSEALTRDRIGFGGPEPDWSSYSAPLPELALPTRLRVRFSSDGSIADGTWSVAGLQTDAYPQARISLAQRTGGDYVATARLSGDFSRVGAGGYRYRSSPIEAWQPASGIFNISGSEIFSVVLDLLPPGIQRAEIALFSGIGGGEYMLGSTGLRRDPGPRPPRLLRNPARGVMVLQTDASSQSVQLTVYDVRGRRRARLTIPPQTTWFEWEPRADNGEWLSSGSYFLRVDGMESSTTRFTWFR